jgi:hypothetical protein
MVCKNSLPRCRPDHGDEAAAGDAISASAIILAIDFVA